jgi:hypothetical protein
MCPACLAAAAMIAGAAVSSTGVAALAVKKLWNRNPADNNVVRNRGKENGNGK